MLGWPNGSQQPDIAFDTGWTMGSMFGGPKGSWQPDIACDT